MYVSERRRLSSGERGPAEGLRELRHGPLRDEGPARGKAQEGQTRRHHSHCDVPVAANDGLFFGIVVTEFWQSPCGTYNRILSPSSAIPVRSLLFLSKLCFPFEFFVDRDFQFEILKKTLLAYIYFIITNLRSSDEGVACLPVTCSAR